MLYVFREQKLSGAVTGSKVQKIVDGASGTKVQKVTDGASGTKVQKIADGGTATKVQKITDGGSGTKVQKLTSAANGNREQKLCCVSSMEGGGTEYPETSDGKPPKPGVSRKRPDRMQCSPRPCQTLFVSGKSLCHIKEPEYRGKTEYLPTFFPSVYFFVLKFWLRKDFYDKY